MAQLIKGKQIATQTIVLSGTSGNVIVSGDFSTNNNQITIGVAPTNEFHAANKAYVDAVAQGVAIHAPVEVITTGQTTLSGVQNIDGVTLSNGDFILVNGQTDAKQNGIYVMSAATWSRRSDADGNPNNEIQLGDFVFVASGITNGSSGWVLATSTSSGSTINPTTDTQNWFKMAAPGSYSTDGQGLELGGSQFYIELDGTTLSKSATGLKLSDGLSTTISTHTTNISSLSSAISSGDLSLSGQISVRTSVDSSLSSAISSGDLSLSGQISVRTSVDSSLSSAISVGGVSTSSLSSAISSGDLSLSGQISVRTSVDSSLSSAISIVDSEVTSLSSAVSSGDLSLSGQISVRTSVDSSLSSAISSGDLSLSGQISVRTSVDLSLSSAISAGDTSLSSAISSGDLSLSGQISVRTSVDSSLSSAISSGGVSTSSLSSAISSGDLSLSGQISVRTSVDVSLSSAISSGGVSNSSLSSAISSGDLSLSGQISIRTSVDSSLSSAVSSGDLSLSGAISIRTSVDSSLSSAISTVDSRATSLSTAIDNISNPNIIEEPFAPDNNGIISATGTTVHTTTFGYGAGVVDVDSVVVFLNGVQYPFAYAGASTVFHTGSVTPAGTNITLYFNNVNAGFIIETTDSVILKYMIVT